MAGITNTTVPPGAPPLASQVESRIGVVERSWVKAMTALDGSVVFGQSDAEKTAQHNVRQFQDDVAAWAVAGRVAAKAGKSPAGYQTGWKGWADQAVVFVDGFAAQAEFDRETFSAFVTTVQDAPKQAGSDLKAGAKAVGGVVQTAAQHVGSGVLMPLGVALGVYILAQIAIRRA